MNRKGRLVILGILLLCAVCFVALAIAAGLRLEEPVKPAESAVKWRSASYYGIPIPDGDRDNPPPEPSAEEEVYIIKPYKGYMAVYRPEETEPFEITETPIGALLEADQEMIRGGVTLHGWEELAHFLEDFAY